jgi:hypothetical protein
LSTSQLDATSTVAGTFSYSPAVGAVLAVAPFWLWVRRPCRLPLPRPIRSTTRPRRLPFR